MGRHRTTKLRLTPLQNATFWALAEVGRDSYLTVLNTVLPSEAGPAEVARLNDELLKLVKQEWLRIVHKDGQAVTEEDLRRAQRRVHRRGPHGDWVARPGKAPASIELILGQGAYEAYDMMELE